MAQPKTDPTESNNFAANIVQYMQQMQHQIQHLSDKVAEQQTQYNMNQESSQKLQNNLNTFTQNNNQDFKDMEEKLNNINITNNNNNNNNNIRKTGIIDSTQGTLTVTHNNKQLKKNHYQSDKYHDFASMSEILRRELLDGCDKLNFTHPSKIQAEAIPRCLASGYPNLIGQAHHGSGKTATFALIMLQRIDENIIQLQGLVVVHSRELAIQTCNVIKSLGQFITELKIGLALKGERIANNQWDCQICVGTPGTIIDKILHRQKRNVSGLKGFLKYFRILIVDEADEFLKASSKKKSKSKKATSGFGNLFDQLLMITTDIKENTLANENEFQTLLFSATYPPTVKKLAIEIAPNPFIIKVAQKQVQLDNIRVFKILCEDEVDKFNTLLRVVSLANIGQMIIFVNTVSKAKQLIDGLESKDIGVACSALYGRGMDISIRDITMEQFRKSQTQCLVASNVIARGIDVPSVGLVVNFEIPMNTGQSFQTGQTGFTFDSETFMHRVGRTGRFGSKGVCINLVSKDDSIGNDRLDAIQKEYSLNITLINKDAKSIKESITSWLHDTV